MHVLKNEQYWALFPLFKMKSLLQFFRNISSLECRKPIISDTNLEGVRLEKLQENIIEQAEKVSSYLKILTSGLIEAATFPTSFLSPKLLQLCMDHYDVRTKSILNKDEEPVFSISWQTISSILHNTHMIKHSSALAFKFLNI